ncbi:unnamed protein product [Amoebophrya sp. A25]|nr:unnamed protein product [Amoebophrya sp. A25]|eukprot:GSA25T00002152001.1
MEFGAHAQHIAERKQRLEKKFASHHPVPKFPLNTPSPVANSWMASAATSFSSPGDSAMASQQQQKQCVTKGIANASEAPAVGKGQLEHGSVTNSEMVTPITATGSGKVGLMVKGNQMSGSEPWSSKDSIAMMAPCGSKNRKGYGVATPLMQEAATCGSMGGELTSSGRVKEEDSTTGESEVTTSSDPNFSTLALLPAAAPDIGPQEHQQMEMALVTANSPLFIMHNEDLGAMIVETEDPNGYIEYLTGAAPIPGRYSPQPRRLLTPKEDFSMSRDTFVIWDRDDTRVFVAVSQLTSRAARLSGRLAPHHGRPLGEEEAQQRRQGCFSMWWDSGACLRESPKKKLQYYPGQGVEVPSKRPSARSDIPSSQPWSQHFEISEDSLVIWRYRFTADGHSKFVDAYIHTKILEASERDTKDWEFRGALARYEPTPSYLHHLRPPDDIESKGSKGEAVSCLGPPQQLQIKGPDVFVESPRKGATSSVGKQGKKCASFGTTMTMPRIGGFGPLPSFPPSEGVPQWYPKGAPLSAPGKAKMGKSSSSPFAAHFAPQAQTKSNAPDLTVLQQQFYNHSNPLADDSTHAHVGQAENRQDTTAPMTLDAALQTGDGGMGPGGPAFFGPPANGIGRMDVAEALQANVEYAKSTSASSAAMDVDARTLPTATADAGPAATSHFRLEQSESMLQVGGEAPSNAMRSAESAPAATHARESVVEAAQPQTDTTNTTDLLQAGEGAPVAAAEPVANSKKDIVDTISVEFVKNSKKNLDTEGSDAQASRDADGMTQSEMATQRAEMAKSASSKTDLDETCATPVIAGAMTREQTETAANIVDDISNMMLGCSAARTGADTMEKAGPVPLPGDDNNSTELHRQEASRDAGDNTTGKKDGDVKPMSHSRTATHSDIKVKEVAEAGRTAGGTETLKREARGSTGEEQASSRIEDDHEDVDFGEEISASQAATAKRSASDRLEAQDGEDKEIGNARAELQRGASNLVARPTSQSNRREGNAPAAHDSADADRASGGADAEIPTQTNRKRRRIRQAQSDGMTPSSEQREGRPLETMESRSRSQNKSEMKNLGKCSSRSRAGEVPQKKLGSDTRPSATESIRFMGKVGHIDVGRDRSPPRGRSRSSLQASRQRQQQRWPQAPEQSAEQHYNLDHGRRTDQSSIAVVGEKKQGLPRWAQHPYNFGPPLEGLKKAQTRYKRRNQAIEEECPECPAAIKERGKMAQWYLDSKFDPAWHLGPAPKGTSPPNGPVRRVKKPLRGSDADLDAGNSCMHTPEYRYQPLDDADPPFHPFHLTYYPGDAGSLFLVHERKRFEERERLRALKAKDGTPLLSEVEVWNRFFGRQVLESDHWPAPQTTNKASGPGHRGTPFAVGALDDGLTRKIQREPTTFERDSLGPSGSDRKPALQANSKASGHRGTTCASMSIEAVVPVEINAGASGSSDVLAVTSVTDEAAVADEVAPVVITGEPDTRGREGDAAATSSEDEPGSSSGSVPQAPSAASSLHSAVLVAASRTSASGSKNHMPSNAAPGSSKNIAPAASSDDPAEFSAAVPAAKTEDGAESSEALPAAKTEDGVDSSEALPAAKTEDGLDSSDTAEKTEDAGDSNGFVLAAKTEDADNSNGVVPAAKTEDAVDLDSGGANIDAFDSSEAVVAAGKAEDADAVGDGVPAFLYSASELAESVVVPTGVASADKEVRKIMVPADSIKNTELAQAAAAASDLEVCPPEQKRAKTSERSSKSLEKTAEAAAAVTVATAELDMDNGSDEQEDMISSKDGPRKAAVDEPHRRQGAAARPHRQRSRSRRRRSRKRRHDSSRSRRRRRDRKDRRRERPASPQKGDGQKADSSRAAPSSSTAASPNLSRKNLGENKQEAGKSQPVEAVSRSNRGEKGSGKGSRRGEKSYKGTTGKNSGPFTRRESGGKKGSSSWPGKLEDIFAASTSSLCTTSWPSSATRSSAQPSNQKTGDSDDIFAFVDLSLGDAASKVPPPLPLETPTSTKKGTTPTGKTGKFGGKQGKGRTPRVAEAAAGKSGKSAAHQDGKKGMKPATADAGGTTTASSVDYGKIYNAWNGLPLSAAPKSENESTQDEKVQEKTAWEAPPPPPPPPPPEEDVVSEEAGNVGKSGQSKKLSFCGEELDAMTASSWT